MGSFRDTFGLLEYSEQLVTAGRLWTTDIDTVSAEAAVQMEHGCLKRLEYVPEMQRFHYTWLRGSMAGALVGEGYTHMYVCVYVCIVSQLPAG